jgi:nicotinamidase-related amidase
MLWCVDATPFGEARLAPRCKPDACVRRTAEGALRRGIAVTVPRVGVASRSTAAVDRGLRAIRRAGGTTQ